MAHRVRLSRAADRLSNVDSHPVELTIAADGVTLRSWSLDDGNGPIQRINAEEIWLSQKEALRMAAALAVSHASSWPIYLKEAREAVDE